MICDLACSFAIFYNFVIESDQEFELLSIIVVWMQSKVDWSCKTLDTIEVWRMFKFDEFMLSHLVISNYKSHETMTFSTEG